MVCHSKSVLVTGITGLIGGEIAARLCEEGFTVWGLIRARSDSQAARRVKARFVRSGRNVPPNLHTVAGDICQKSLGIHKSHLNRIREECDLVVHAAGNTSFKNNGGCYSTNIKGVFELIQELKTWSRTTRIFYISTSFVSCAPKHSEISEESPQIGHANEYIESKRQAEKLLKRSGLDVIILRPSIVISKGLYDRKFARSILWFILVALKLGSIPLDKTASVDIVTVNYVVECLYNLINKKPSFDCYHLTAGTESSVSCGEVADMVHSIYKKHVSFVSLPIWLQQWKNVRTCKMMTAASYYLPFLNSDVTYSCSRIQKELGNKIPTCPKFTEYCKDMLSLITDKEALLESAAP